MRIFPIITAIVVIFVLYMFVIKRDMLLSFSDDAPQEMVEQNEMAPTAPGVSVVVQPSRATSIQNGILLRGRTEASRRVDVRAEASGRITSQPLRKGVEVAAGQLLCELDPGTSLSQLAEAVARLDDAENNAQNAADLAERGFGPETAVIASKAALESARSGLMRVQQSIDNLMIYAPFSGFLETDTAEIGSLITPGGLCATVIDLDQIKLVGFATEQDIDKIKLNSLAGGRLVSGDEIVGTVTFISRASDPVSRTFRVEITVPNDNHSIRDGETANLAIALDGEIGHLLPQHVLTLNNEGQLGVRIADNGITRFVRVEILRDTPEGLWLKGLPETADVIIVGQEYVVDGSPVLASPVEEVTQ